MSCMSTDTTSLITSAMKSALAQPAATDPMGTLAKAIAGASDTDHALHALHLAAEAEVTTRQWQHVDMVIDSGRTPVEALRLVVKDTTSQIIGRGADDTWSGRSNDLKRVRFDALRIWIDRTSHLLPES
jgi:hypothetical protein